MIREGNKGGERFNETGCRMHTKKHGRSRNIIGRLARLKIQFNDPFSVLHVVSKLWGSVREGKNSPTI